MEKSIFQKITETFNKTVKINEKLKALDIFFIKFSVVGIFFITTAAIFLLNDISFLAIILFVFFSISLCISIILKYITVYRKIFLDILYFVLYSTFSVIFIYLDKCEHLILLSFSIPLFNFFGRQKNSLIYGLVFYFLIFLLYLNRILPENQLKFWEFSFFYLLFLFIFYYFQVNLFNSVQKYENDISKNDILRDIDFYLIKFFVQQIRTNFNNLSVFFENIDKNNLYKIDWESIKSHSLLNIEQNISSLENLYIQREIKDESFLEGNLFTMFLAYFENENRNLAFRFEGFKDIKFKSFAKKISFLRIFTISLMIIKLLCAKKVKTIKFVILEDEEYLKLRFTIHQASNISLLQNINNYILLLNEFLEDFIGYYEFLKEYDDFIFQVSINKSLLVLLNAPEKESKNLNELTFTRLLIADDDILNQKILKFGLENYFEYIDVADNGQEALNYATSKKYDLIIVDIQMPYLNGIEFTRKIRDLEKYLSVKNIIFGVSANNINYTRQELLEIGFDDFFVKPYKVSEILEAFNHKKNKL